MSADISDPHLVQAAQDVHNEAQSTSWLVAVYGPSNGASAKLLLHSSGGEPVLPQLRTALDDSAGDMASFGYAMFGGKGLIVVRMSAGAVGVKRARIVVHSRAFANFVPEYLSLETITSGNALTDDLVKDRLGLVTLERTQPVLPASLPETPSAVQDNSHSFTTLTPSSPFIQPPLPAPSSPLPPVPEGGEISISPDLLAASYHTRAQSYQTETPLSPPLMLPTIPERSTPGDQEVSPEASSYAERSTSDYPTEARDESEAEQVIQLSPKTSVFGVAAHRAIDRPSFHEAQIAHNSSLALLGNLGNQPSPQLPTQSPSDLPLPLTPRGLHHQGMESQSSIVTDYGRQSIDSTFQYPSTTDSRRASRDTMGLPRSDGHGHRRSESGDTFDARRTSRDTLGQPHGISRDGPRPSSVTTVDSWRSSHGQDEPRMSSTSFGERASNTSNTSVADKHSPRVSLNEHSVADDNFASTNGVVGLGIGIPTGLSSSSSPSSTSTRQTATPLTTVLTPGSPMRTPRRASRDPPTSLWPQLPSQPVGPLRRGSREALSAAFAVASSNTTRKRMSRDRMLSTPSQPGSPMGPPPSAPPSAPLPPIPLRSPARTRHSSVHKLLPPSTPPPSQPLPPIPHPKPTPRSAPQADIRTLPEHPPPGTSPSTPLAVHVRGATLSPAMASSMDTAVSLRTADDRTPDTTVASIDHLTTPVPSNTATPSQSRRLSRNTSLSKLSPRKPVPPMEPDLIGAEMSHRFSRIGLTVEIEAPPSLAAVSESQGMSPSKQPTVGPIQTTDDTADAGTVSPSLAMESMPGSPLAGEIREAAVVSLATVEVASTAEAPRIVGLSKGTLTTMVNVTEPHGGSAEAGQMDNDVEYQPPVVILATPKLGQNASAQLSASDAVTTSGTAADAAITPAIVDLGDQSPVLAHVLNASPGTEQKSSSTAPHSVSKGSPSDSPPTTYYNSIGLKRRPSQLNKTLTAGTERSLSQSNKASKLRLPFRSPRASSNSSGYESPTHSYNDYSPVLPHLEPSSPTRNRKTSFTAFRRKKNPGISSSPSIHSIFSEEKGIGLGFTNLPTAYRTSTGGIGYSPPTRSPKDSSVPVMSAASALYNARQKSLAEQNEAQEKWRRLEEARAQARATASLRTPEMTSVHTLPATDGRTPSRSAVTPSFSATPRLPSDQLKPFPAKAEAIPNAPVSGVRVDEVSTTPELQYKIPESQTLLIGSDDKGLGSLAGIETVLDAVVVNASNEPQPPSRNNSGSASPVSQIIDAASAARQHRRDVRDSIEEQRARSLSVSSRGHSATGGSGSSPLVASNTVLVTASPPVDHGSAPSSYNGPGASYGYSPRFGSSWSPRLDSSVSPSPGIGASPSFVGTSSASPSIGHWSQKSSTAPKIPPKLTPKTTPQSDWSAYIPTPNLAGLESLPDDVSKQPAAQPQSSVTRRRSSASGHSASSKARAAGKHDISGRTSLSKERTPRRSGSGRAEAEAKRAEVEERARVRAVEREQALRAAAEAEATRQAADTQRRARREAEEAERKAQKAVLLKQLAHTNDAEDGAVILRGWVTVQTMQSLTWRRRYFHLLVHEMRMYKGDNDIEPLSVLRLRPGASVSQTYEESQVRGSWKLTTSTGDDIFMFADNAEDKEVILEGLALAMGRA